MFMVVRDAGLLATCVRIYNAHYCHIEERIHFKYGGITKCAIIVRSYLKAMSHNAIFLATGNAILFLGDVKLANTCFHHSFPLYF